MQLRPAPEWAAAIMRSSISVLLVTDDPDFVLALSDLLALEQVECRGARDLAGTVAAVELHRPDVVVVDATARGHRERQVARAVRAASIPLILLSDTFTGTPCWTDGAIVFRRPPDPRELIASIRAAPRFAPAPSECAAPSGTSG